MGVIDVHITFDGTNFVPSQDPVTLSKSGGESIQWHNDAGRTILISFDSGCPFGGTVYPYQLRPGQQKQSGMIHCDPDTTWKYSISTPGGPITDPQVIIQK